MRIVLNLRCQARFEPYHWTLHEQNLQITFIQKPSWVVPFASLNKHSTDINTVIRGRWVFILDHFVVKDKLVNRDLILSGIILETTGEETLSEIELVYPEERWNTLIDPSLEEFQSLLEILDITSKGLQRWVTLAFPELRNFTIKERFQGFF